MYIGKKKIAPKTETRQNIKVNVSDFFYTSAHDSRQLNILGTVSSLSLTSGVFSGDFPITSQNRRPATLALLLNIHIFLSAASQHQESHHDPPPRASNLRGLLP